MGGHVLVALTHHIVNKDQLVIDRNPRLIGPFTVLKNYNLQRGVVQAG